MFLRARHFYRNFFRHILKTTPFTPEPNTQKEVTKCSNVNYIVGACSMQGWRVSKFFKQRLKKKSNGVVFWLKFLTFQITLHLNST